MNKKHIVILSLGFLLVLSAVFVLADRPTQGGHDGNWGIHLNDWLDVGHDDTGSNDAYVDLSIVGADVALNTLVADDIADTDTLGLVELLDGLSLVAAAEDLTFTVDADDNFVVSGVGSDGAALTAGNMAAYSGANIVFEGTAADAFETTITVANPTVADKTVTFLDQGGNVILQTADTIGADPAYAANGIAVGTTGIIFEGAFDAFETLLTVTDPTADRTITFPNQGGFALLFASSNNQDQNIIFDGATVNAIQTTFAISDPSGADQTFELPDNAPVGITTYRLLFSTLTTNAIDVVNSVWAESNALAFEGATANDFELRLNPRDVTADVTGNVAVGIAVANQACDTTCSGGTVCVAGYDTGTNALVACNSGIADRCICF